MRVVKCGDDLAVLLTVDIVERFGLKEGDDVTITAIRPPVVPTSPEERARVLEALRAFRGRLPADWRVDRDSRNAR